MNYQTFKLYIEEYNRYISGILIFLILTLSVSYIYLINSSILNTVAREQNDKQISLMASDIAELENSYMNTRASLSIDMAKTLGFSDDFKKVHFSSETPNVTGSLTLLRDEI
ncbi:MAG: hypothetical protein HY225_03400 [Candidatus Vogelbacteria bacterium]|nr:hypothetical protein [Candidatus Vogelbacteria bacterium]